MIRRLYDWTLSLAKKESAEKWLGLIAFIESSFFLVPADVLFLPMVLANKKKAYRYAFTATLFSVLGGILGWYIGFYAFEAIAKPVLEFYGKLEKFETLRGNSNTNTILLMLVTSGLTHLPPIKIVTILSGVMKTNLWGFIISAIIARGARFFFLAWLLKKYGSPIQEFVEKRLGFIAGAFAALLITLYFFVKYFL
jgi:membrane protein YqaA with SNARE-associated domain